MIPSLPVLDHDLRYASLMAHPSLPKSDGKLLQIIDQALAGTTRKSGDWLVCRKGCTQCCIGVFAINQLDAVRLKHGMVELKMSNPKKAAEVRERARSSVKRLSPHFPGNTQTGILASNEKAEERFTDFANDEPCPALSPETGECELYEHRPMTCRVFGPPVRTGEDGALGVCELCYHGATPEEIAICEMAPDPDDIESGLNHEVEKKTGVRGNTIIAFCLAK